MEEQLDFRLPKPWALPVVKMSAAPRRARPAICRFIPKPPLTGLELGMTATSFSDTARSWSARLGEGDSNYPDRPRLHDADTLPDLQMLGNGNCMVWVVFSSWKGPVVSVG